MSVIEFVLRPRKVVNIERLLLVVASLLLLCHAGLYIAGRFRGATPAGNAPSTASDRESAFNTSVLPSLPASAGAQIADANGPSLAPANRGIADKPQASVFDTGAPPVPFLSPVYTNSLGTFPGVIAAPAAVDPASPTRTASPPRNEKAAGIVSDDRARRLARKPRDNSPSSSKSDPNQTAAVSVPTDLAGWIATLAGIDPNHPDRFAPPPLGNDLRAFYRDDPTHPWLARRLP